MLCVVRDGADGVAWQWQPCGRRLGSEAPITRGEPSRQDGLMGKEASGPQENRVEMGRVGW